MKKIIILLIVIFASVFTFKNADAALFNKTYYAAGSGAGEMGETPSDAWINQTNSPRTVSVWMYTETTSGWSNVGARPAVKNFCSSQIEVGGPIYLQVSSPAINPSTGRSIREDVTVPGLYIFYRNGIYCPYSKWSGIGFYFSWGSGSYATKVGMASIN